MAPYADEIDVYKVPHSRIKRLVSVYLNKVSNTNFSSCDAMHQILTELYYTFHEFKCHEQIENDFIIKKLKNKLNALSSNSANTNGYAANEKVCNCHSDNRLLDMLTLFENGLKYDTESKSADERISYGHKLVEALDDFTKHFLPHMEEEEEVFQPLLMRYFTYEELKALKRRVLLEHVETWKERERAGMADEREHEKFVLEQLAQGAQNKPDAGVPRAVVVASPGRSLSSLPRELQETVLSYLSVAELGRASLICRQWHRLIYSSKCLWARLQPAGWWHVATADEHTARSKEASSSYAKYLDEDVDIDESTGSEGSSCSDTDSDSGSDSQQLAIRLRMHSQSRRLASMAKHLLPKIGEYVEVLDFSGFTALTSSTLCKILYQCGGDRTSLTTLILADTDITDAAFKCVPSSRSPCGGGGAGLLGKLEHLDLSGCSALTDDTLIRLVTGALAYSTTTTPRPADEQQRSGGGACRAVSCCGGEAQTPPVNSTLRHVALSGCHLLTDAALAPMVTRVYAGLRHLDLSGCPLVTGPALRRLVRSALPHLAPSSLYYCDNVEHGPYPLQANGCQNVDSESGRACCRGTAACHRPAPTPTTPHHHQHPYHH